MSDQQKRSDIARSMSIAIKPHNWYYISSPLWCI